MRRLVASLRGAAEEGLQEFAVRRLIAAQLQAPEEKLSQCKRNRESTDLLAREKPPATIAWVEEGCEGHIALKVRRCNL